MGGDRKLGEDQVRPLLEISNRIVQNCVEPCVLKRTFIGTDLILDNRLGPEDDAVKGADRDGFEVCQSLPVRNEDLTRKEHSSLQPGHLSQVVFVDDLLRVLLRRMNGSF